MNTRMLDAFLAVRNGFSPDRVVADPELNARFLDACRARGLMEPEEELNRALLNARKASALVGQGTEKPTRIKGQREFSFASEIAIRSIERKYSATLDQVICSPRLAAEFDDVAARICPGHSPLEYRWAALRIRKARRLQPERVAQVRPPIQVINVRVAELTVDNIPPHQGLYLFFDSERMLYVGESNNLRKRLLKHLEHSDNKGLARWLWSHGPEGLHVEFHVLPDDTSAKVRRALESELIASRNPEFNVRDR